MYRNITPEFDYTAVDMSGYFDEAAKKFGDNYAVWSDILGKIGWAYRKEYTKININLTNMSQKNGQIINSTCKELYNQTLFSRYFYQKQEKITLLSHRFCNG